MSVHDTAFKYPWQAQEITQSYRNADDIVAMDFVNLKNKHLDQVHVCNSIQFGVFVIIRGSTLCTYSSKIIENFARRSYSENDKASHCQDPSLNLEFDDLPTPICTMKLPCACELMELSMTDHALVVCLTSGQMFICRHIQHIAKTPSSNRSQVATEVSFDKCFVGLSGAEFNLNASKLCWSSNAILLLVSNNEDGQSQLQCFDFDGQQVADLTLEQHCGSVTSVCGQAAATIHSRFCLGFANSSISIVDFMPDVESSLERGRLHMYVGVDRVVGGYAIGLCFLSSSCVVGMRVDSNQTVSLRLIDVDETEGVGTWREDNETSNDP